MTIKHKSQKYYSTSIFHFTLMGYSQYKVVVNPHFYAVVCFSLPFISFSFTSLDSTLVLHVFSVHSIFSLPYAIWMHCIQCILQESTSLSSLHLEWNLTQFKDIRYETFSDANNYLRLVREMQDCKKLKEEMFLWSGFWHLIFGSY